MEKREAEIWREIDEKERKEKNEEMERIKRNWKMGKLEQDKGRG